VLLLPLIAEALVKVAKLPPYNTIQVKGVPCCKSCIAKLEPLVPARANKEFTHTILGFPVVELAQIPDDEGDAVLFAVDE
jgi:hypothetical protein